MGEPAVESVCTASAFGIHTWWLGGNTDGLLSVPALVILQGKVKDLLSLN